MLRHNSRSENRKSNSLARSLSRSSMADPTEEENLLDDPPSSIPSSSSPPPAGGRYGLIFHGKCIGYRTSCETFVACTKLMHIAHQEIFHIDPRCGCWN